MGVRKWWTRLAVAAAGGLVLLVVLLLRGSPGSGDRADGREGVPPPAPRGAPPAVPPAVPQPPAGAENGKAGALPGTERWYYEDFLRRAAADPDDFARLAGEKAGSDAPLQERVALLRAAWKVRGSEALGWFADAFAAPGVKPEADTLRGFVVRYLVSHGAAVPEVRRFLWDKVFLDGAVRTRERSAAGRGVLQAAEAAEIQALLGALRGITDPDVAEGALVGLRLNRSPEAAAAFTWLAANHPEESVRERAAEVARRRLTRDGEDEED